ncbi:MAG TPA: hypothetical protein VF585_02975 [Chthoniobacterales bacterium]|jgi:tetratricopeptide (TPR) repeat protein
MERQIVMVPNLFRDPATFDPLYRWLAVPGVLFILFLAVSLWRRGPLLRVRRFGVLWFVATILPVSNVFALNATIAEHWLYIPSIGFLIILVGSALETSPKMQRFLAIATLFAAAGLGIRTKQRVQDWISPIAFFEATIRDGGDTARMRVNLANEYQLSGNLAKGEELFRSVLTLSPNYAQARHGLVGNLTRQGRTEEARYLFAKEATPFGNSFRGQLYAADRLIANGELAEASAVLKQLREAHANSWLLRKEIGLLFEKMGQPAQKMALYMNFTEQHWWHAESHVELGRLLEAAHQPEAAADAYAAAARLDVRDTTRRARAEELRKRARAHSPSS